MDIMIQLDRRGNSIDYVISGRLPSFSALCPGGTCLFHEVAYIPYLKTGFIVLQIKFPLSSSTRPGTTITHLVSEHEF